MVQLSLIGEQDSSTFSVHLLQAKANLKLKATNFKVTSMVQLSLIGEQDSNSFSVHLSQAKANLKLKATLR